MNIYFRAKHLINNLMKKGKDDKNDIFGAFKDVFRCNQDTLMMLELSKKIEYHDNIGT